jgi:3-O-methylgallate 3,4-dioxygenase
MADVVLAIGTSHSPMLNASAQEWGRFEQREPTTKLRDREGRPSSYAALLQEAGNRYEGQATPARFAERHGAAQAALDRLAAEIRDAHLDALVIFGDDQKELFHADNLPALMVYTGATLSHRMRPPKPEWVDWFAQVQSRYYPQDDIWQHPVDSPLANHLVESLIGADFDPALCERLPRDEGMGHAFAFVHQRLFGWHRPSFLPPMPRLEPAVPVVPVFINTYYPPNQPSPARCYQLGQAVRAAIERWPAKARVGVLGSGGLSHFAIDEELDGRIVRALRDRDRNALVTLPRELLNSGNSEIRNWIAMAGAGEHLPHAWTEYVPAYRTPAGTGTGMCFSVSRH